MRAPYLARSTGYTWASGSPINVDPAFLGSIPPFDAPEIKNLRFRFNGLVSVTAANTFFGRVMAQLFQQCVINDGKGPRVNMLGSSIREASQREFGNSFADPADMAGVLTNAPFDVELVLPYELRRLTNPEDTRMPVSDLLGPGGAIVLNMNTANGINGANVTIVSGTVEVYAEIVEGGVPTARSRVFWQDIAMAAVDNLYPVNGLLYDLWIRTSDANINSATALATQNITSAGLYLATMSSFVMNDDYFRQLQSQNAHDDVAAGFAINVFCARRFQQISQLGLFGSIQVRTDGSLIAGSRVVVAAVTKRNAEQSAAALGYNSAAQALEAVAQSGAVVSRTGTIAAGGVSRDLAPYLPARVAGANAKTKQQGQ